MKIYAKTNNLDRKQWLELRTNGIGGSDVSIIAGINPFKSTFQLWMEKTGLMELEETDSDYAYFGTVLEPLVRKEFTRRTGKKVRTRKCMFQHEDHPFMLADLDGLIYDPDEGCSIFEAKTASAYKWGVWEKGVPDEYQLQIQHYMAVTGTAKTYVAALVGGNRFVWHIVERDEELISLIIAMEHNFWHNHVLRKQPPELDGSKATTDYLSKKYKHCDSQIIELPADSRALVDNYDHLSSEIKLLTEKKNEVANKLKSYLQEHEQGIVDDKVVKWGAVSKEQFNQKKFRQEHEELYQKYMEQTTYRRFSIA